MTLFSRAIKKRSLVNTFVVVRMLEARITFGDDGHVKTFLRESLP
jgi:hypothetical protein